MTRKFGCWLLILFAGSSAFAAGAGTISGYVTDSAGTPQMGAVVDVFTSASVLGSIVFTDSRGHYEAANLPPGRYHVKVSAASFLPSLQQNIKVAAGSRVLVNLTLSTLADALKFLPPRRDVSTDPDDWHWTLRSTVNRPVLRALEQDTDQDGSLIVVSSNANAETQKDQALKARVGFLAGDGDVTTSFALEKSIFSAGVFALNGNISGQSSDPTGVIRASYTHQLGEVSQPAVTITYRRFAFPGTALENSPYEAVSLNTSDSMSVAGFLDVQYGADLQSLQFGRRVMAARPYASADVHLSPDLVVEYRYATSEPDSRAAKGFDSAPADLSESGPRMALTNGVPEIERSRHQEVSVSRRFGNTSIQAACYRDNLRDQVLTGAGDPSAYSDDVMPDVYAGTFAYAFPGQLDTTGARIVVERKFSDDLTATMDYSNGGAVTAQTLSTWQSVPQALGTSRRHAVAAKFSGHVPGAGTRWIASYKWTSGNTISTVDAFNTSAGQADPYLSIFIRQPLPSAGFIPAKMDALLDIRNLLAEGYLPVTGQDGRTVYMVQSARVLRGGLAFTF